MSNRRKFIKNFGLGAVGLTMINHELIAQEDVKRIILHTNDMHSRIEPFSSEVLKE